MNVTSDGGYPVTSSISEFAAEVFVNTLNRGDTITEACKNSGLVYLDLFVDLHIAIREERLSVASWMLVQLSQYSTDSMLAGHMEFLLWWFGNLETYNVAKLFMNAE